METREKILRKILMRLMDNEHTSASRGGLIHRAMNRQEAITSVLNLLNITQKEAETMYWEWVK